MDVFGCIFSLGLLPIFLYFHVQSIPRKLTEQELILANGTAIPWSAFTKAKIVKRYYGRAYLGSRFFLNYGSRKLVFGTTRVANESEVTSFIVAHLPPEIVRS